MLKSFPTLRVLFALWWIFSSARAVGWRRRHNRSISVWWMRSRNSPRRWIPSRWLLARLTHSYACFCVSNKSSKAWFLLNIIRFFNQTWQKIKHFLLKYLTQHGFNLFFVFFCFLSLKNNETNLYNNLLLLKDSFLSNPIFPFRYQVFELFVSFCLQAAAKESNAEERLTPVVLAQQAAQLKQQLVSAHLDTLLGPQAHINLADPDGALARWDENIPFVRERIPSVVCRQISDYISKLGGNGWSLWSQLTDLYWRKSSSSWHYIV